MHVAQIGNDMKKVIKYLFIKLVFILTMYSQGVILHHMLSLEDLLITYLHVTSVLPWIKYPLHKLSLMEF